LLTEERNNLYRQNSLTVRQLPDFDEIWHSACRL
jgi:hypothetical protein